MRRGPRVSGIFDWLKKRPGEQPPPSPPPPAGRQRFDPSVDYYGVLGVSPQATDDEIRSAFRRLGVRYHPDRDPSPEAARVFRLVTDAYHVLTDESTRSAYDRARRIAPPSPAAPPPRPAPPPSRAMIVPGEARVPSIFAPFGPPPPPGPAAPAPPGPPPSAPPARPPTMWEVMFGAPEALAKTPPKGPTIFDPFAAPPPMPAARPSAPVRPAPPPAAPVPYGVAAPPPPEIFPSREEMAEYMKAVWPLDAIWDLVRDSRGTAAFRASGIMAVDRLAGYEPGDPVEYEASDWLGIARELVDDYNRRGLLQSAFWSDVLMPMFEIAGAALNVLKPADLPGFFRIIQSGLGVDLYYAEEAGRRPWK